MKFLLIGAVILIASLKPAASYNEEGISDSFIRDSFAHAKFLVDKAYIETRNNLKVRLRRETVQYSDIVAFFKQPVAGSRNAIRSADYMDMTLQVLAKNLKRIYPSPGNLNISDVLSPEQKEILFQLTGCAYMFLPKECPPSRYRSITGECNNRENSSLGASNTGFKRLLPPVYEDGISLPNGWTESRKINEFHLPKARDVSNQVAQFRNLTTFDPDRSIMFMQWGQFQVHDTDLAPDTPARSTFFDGVDCENSCVQSHPCFPLTIPENDPRIKNTSDCIPLFRSAPVCNIFTPVREQINVRTSYVDGSQIYGSEKPLAKKLRNNTNDLGLLAINQNYTDNGFALLPFTEDSLDICVNTNRSAAIPCFLAGDDRANDMVGLTAFHTLFLREHNRIATQLHELNPHWSGETLYQETRMIISSMVQKISFKDWLPLLLGSEMGHVLPPYTSYNDTEDPRVSNAFGLGFRMGHTLVHPVAFRLADGYRPHEIEPTVLLRRMLFASWRIVKQGGIDPFLRGMMSNHAKLNVQNKIMVGELRDHLFEMVMRIGLDLAAINIQRCREHGLPGYNAWRRFCGLSAPRDLDELTEVLENRELAEKLLDLYGTPENIDLWIGGVSEPLVLDGRTGKLLSCIIGDQYRRTRDGDWFYYENPSVFTPAKRMSIESVTMSQIICANTNITEVPLNVFLGNEYPRDFVDCSNIPTLDLSPWKECPPDDNSNMKGSSKV